MKSFLPKLFFAVLLVSSAVLPQQKRTFTFDAGQSAFIPEIKGMAVFEKGILSLSFVPPADQREKEYQQVDLQSGDEIQFVNGIRIKSLSDFKKSFGDAKVGEEVKLGIKRSDQRFIVAFKKAKQEMGDQRIIRMGGEGKGDAKIEGGKIIMGNKKLDLDSLKKAGGKIIMKSDSKK